jgi:hypothetical protein
MRVVSSRRGVLTVLAMVAAVMGGLAGGLSGVCGPFTDVAGDVFCPFVLEIFYLGITTGTTATTYDPTANVSRLQMAAFLARTVDGALRRGSRRAAMDQFWTSQNSSVLGLTTVGTTPNFLRSDGTDVWVSNSTSGSISRVRASDGKLLETWGGAGASEQLVVAIGKIFVAGYGNPSSLYRIDPSQPAGLVTTVASTLGAFAFGIGFDGGRIWTANNGASVSIVTPGATIPWTVTTVTVGFDEPLGVVHDGGNIWVTDQFAGTLLKLDAAGAILQTVTLGGSPQFPAFDGSNIWVPVGGTPKVAVVRASTGALLATLTGNGIASPFEAAFDGQRILVATAANVASLWKAADLSPIGAFPLGAGVDARGVCSDGVNFWIAFHTPGQIARF